jgi:O-antigen/teichoic acid export membrane protein
VVIDNVAHPVTRFSLIAVAVFLGFGAVGVAWAYAGGFAAAAAVSVYYLARGTPLLEPVETTTMHRELLAFSAPLMVTATMNMVHSNLDNFVLGYFASTGEVGVYNVAYPLAQLLTVLLTAFGFLFMPIISELHSEGRTAEIVRTYHVVSKWTVLAALPLFLLLVTFPGAVIGATFGEEYVAGGVALAILSLGFFVHVGSGPTGISLMSFGLTRRIMYFNTTTAAANAALNFVLVPRFSYVGAAVATTVGYVVMNALFMAQFHREVGTHPFRAAMLRPAVAAIVLWGGLALVVSQVAPPGLPTLLAVLALFIPAYAAVVVRFGGVEQEEVDLLGSVEDRFDVDLGPAVRVARRFAG